MSFSAQRRPSNSGAADPLPAPKLIFVNRVYWPSKAATAQLLTDLTSGLAAAGAEVHVVASGRETDGPAGVTVHRTGGDETHRGPLSQARNYLRFLARARRSLATLVRPGDRVILKTDPPLLGAWATSLAVARGASVVQWVQDIYPEILPLHFAGLPAWSVAPLRAARNRAWRRSAACVVPGDDMRATVLGQGVPPAQVLTVPNWAPRECEVPPPAPEIAAIRAAWGAERKFVVAYSGNHGRAHEFDTLLAAAARLQANQNVVFVFVGSGPRLPGVQARARELRLGNVRFFDAAPRAALPASLAAADLHVVTLLPGFERVVHPSKMAGIMAAARPAVFIGPTNSVLARLLEEETCGWSFPTGTDCELADLVGRLSADGAACVARGHAARRLYEGRFRFSSALPAWQKLLAPPTQPDRP